MYHVLSTKFNKLCYNYANSGKGLLKLLISKQITIPTYNNTLNSGPKKLLSPYRKKKQTIRSFAKSRKYTKRWVEKEHYTRVL
jgi:hypothetical protein